MKKCTLFLLIVTLFIPLLMPLGLAETTDVINDIPDDAIESLFTLQDEEGNFITTLYGYCFVGDQYISGDNLHYEIIEVDEENHIAIATLLGDATMPDVSWLDIIDQSTPVSTISRKMAMYCTHSDESYIDGDGTQSVETMGGIYDITEALVEELESYGVSVAYSDETHHPHDAGAYRRSRPTAVELLKTQPSAIFDVHRDGIPDPDEYTATIDGEEVSQVRLLVGLSNQNMEANETFAKQIKAVADKLYPDLIKDIYMGKGTYNQDLAPRSILLEMGTYTIAKDLVEKSVPMISEVLYKATFGGIIGSAGASDASNATTQNNSSSPPTGDQETPTDSSADQTESESDDIAPITEDNTGSSTAIWLIVALVVGLLLFAFLSTGGKGGMNKFSRSIREMTGGLFGKKPPNS